MGETPPAWQSLISIVVPHPTQPALLLLADRTSWTLPQLTFDGQLWLADVAPVLAAVRDQLGIQATILRYADVQIDSAAHQLHAVCIVEPSSSDWQTPSVRTRWIAAEELAELELAQPAQRPVLMMYLAELDGAPTPALRVPWAYPGWHASALAWIEAQLARLGYHLLAPVAQLKTWALSCVLRAQTSAGAVYFKTSARLPLFADEPQIIAALSTRYPELIPAPLAVDRERGWLLLADVGAELHAQTELPHWTTVLSAYGEMQRHAAADLDWLHANGCLDRRLAWLEAQIEPLLCSPEVLSRLTADELARLRVLVPQIQARCAELDNCGLPPTLVHGDLHGGNIGYHAGRYAVFDWSDACIAHPFTDLPTMLYDIRERWPDPAIQASARDSYLTQWSSYAALEQLQATWTLAAPIAALHQATSYHALVCSIEQTERHAIEWGVSYWLRQVLQLLDPQPAA